MNKTMNMRGRRGRILAVLLVAALGTQLPPGPTGAAQQRQRKRAHRQPWRADASPPRRPAAGRSRWLDGCDGARPAERSTTTSAATAAPRSECPSSAAPGTHDELHRHRRLDRQPQLHGDRRVAVLDGRAAPLPVQVLTGPATHLLLTPATTTPTAGAGDNLTIAAKDASNNTVTELQRHEELDVLAAPAGRLRAADGNGNAARPLPSAPPSRSASSGGVATVRRRRRRDDAVQGRDCENHGRRRHARQRQRHVGHRRRRARKLRGPDPVDTDRGHGVHRDAHGHGRLRQHGDQLRGQTDDDLQRAEEQPERELRATHLRSRSPPA